MCYGLRKKTWPVFTFMFFRSLGPHRLLRNLIMVLKIEILRGRVGGDFVSNLNRWCLIVSWSVSILHHRTVTSCINRYKLQVDVLSLFHALILTYIKVRLHPLSISQFLISKELFFFSIMATAYIPFSGLKDVLFFNGLCAAHILGSNKRGEDFMGRHAPPRRQGCSILQNHESWSLYF